MAIYTITTDDVPRVLTVPDDNPSGILVASDLNCCCGECLRNCSEISSITISGSYDISDTTYGCAMSKNETISKTWSRIDWGSTFASPSSALQFKLAFIEVGDNCQLTLTSNTGFEVPFPIARTDDCTDGQETDGCGRERITLDESGRQLFDAWFTKGSLSLEWGITQPAPITGNIDLFYSIGGAWSCSMFDDPAFYPGGLDCPQRYVSLEDGPLDCGHEEAVGDETDDIPFTHASVAGIIGGYTASNTITASEGGGSLTGTYSVTVVIA